MIISLQRWTVTITFLLCCFLMLTMSVNAETQASQEGWGVSGSAYLWAAGVKGTDAAGDEIDVSFSDTLEDLDGGLMGIIGAQRGKWTLLADIIYLRKENRVQTITASSLNLN